MGVGFMFDLEGLTQDRMFSWYQTATEQDKELGEKVYSNEELFLDMMFQPGSITHDFISCQSKQADGTWEDCLIDLPYPLGSEPYGHFTYHVRDLGGSAGRFTPGLYRLEIAPEYMGADHVILHEMIHLHEQIINAFPSYYHDAVLWCLYKDLRGKIADLDDRISAHGHVLNSQSIENIGGTHDIMFLLKSFDLDLKKGYALGTVFGYGMTAEPSGTRAVEE